MKLEVGMYARNKIGIIGKIISMQKDSANNDIITIYNGNFHIIHNENIHEFDIVKASHNIIDLIEVGDYVNGCCVEEITQFPRDSFKTIITETSTGFEDETEWFRSEEIKSIVTKEQFESISYKIGD